MSESCIDCGAKTELTDSQCESCRNKAGRMKPDDTRERLSERPPLRKAPTSTASIDIPDLLPASPPPGGNGKLFAVIGAIVVVGLVVAAFAFGQQASSNDDASTGSVQSDDNSQQVADDAQAAQDAADRAEEANSRAAAAAAATRKLERKQKAQREAEAARKAELERAAQTDDCPSFDLDGIDYGAGAGYFDISVHNMQCQEAKNLILAWGAVGNFNGLSAHGWSCQDLGADGETNQFRCEDDRQRAFRWWYGA